jgi:hypothetical protein
MSEIAVIAATAKVSLQEIAKQAKALATGLQNAAPGDKVSNPNNSILYLFDTAENLSKLAEECESFLSK